MKEIKPNTVRAELTPEKLTALLKRFTFAEIAQQYGVSRQNIHRIYQLYVTNNEINPNFERQISPEKEIAFVEKDMADHLVRISIYKVDTEKNKALVGTEKDKAPKWLTIESGFEGQFVSPTKRIEGTVRKVRAYFKDFTILDAEQFANLKPKYSVSRIVMKIEGNEVVTDNVVYENEQSRIQLKVLNKGQQTDFIKNPFAVYVIPKSFPKTRFDTGDLVYNGKKMSEALEAVEKLINKKPELPRTFLKFQKNV